MVTLISNFLNAFLDVAFFQQPTKTKKIQCNAVEKVGIERRKK